MAYTTESPEVFFSSYVPETDGESNTSLGGSQTFWRAKRVVDFVGALLLLPLLAAFALVLLAANPFLNRGPLFYRQARMGRFCEPFTAVKFRSMRVATTETRAADDPLEIDRITPLGMVLRRSRMDELPQILNVLRGDMSLIGPRPDAFEHATTFLELIPEYRARHAARPGISGLAQVTVGYAEGVGATRAKAAADLAYLKNAGYILDLKIYWLTFVTVFSGHGT